MIKDFLNIEYLLDGNEKQIKSYKILKKIKIFDILVEFNPILIGTIPINIDLDNSDLDIVCEVKDFNKFTEIAECYFSKYKEYKIHIIEENLDKAIVVNFFVDDMEIEVYASEEKSINSNGYRHMCIEDRILTLGKESFRNKIVQLKRDGLKTEPAFAKLLNLSGNPYEELLKLENYTNDELVEIISKNK